MVEERSEAYRVTPEGELRMRLFLPAGAAESSRPAIVFFFGGGWTNGTAAHFMPQARRLAEEGMVAACADYRIASVHRTTPFEAVGDAKAAVRWLRIHAARLGVDPRRIAAAGGSAGGHLAACAAMIDGFEERGAGESAVSSRPDALVLFNPVLDTTAAGYGREKVTPARETEMSPCHHVRPGLPPVLVMHGDADTVSPFENAERFVRDMRAAGNDCRLAAYAGRGHGFFNRRERPDGSADDADFEATLRETTTFFRSLRWLRADPAIP